MRCGTRFFPSDSVTAIPRTIRKITILSMSCRGRATGGSQRRGKRLAMRIFTRARGTSGSDATAGTRSEEHTSELQSLRHLVCRLLLEKKKKTKRKKKKN